MANDTVGIITVSRTERRAVEDARDAMHRAVLDILKARGVDSDNLDLTDIGESIALEGYFEVN